MFYYKYPELHPLTFHEWYDIIEEDLEMSLSVPVWYDDGCGGELMTQTRREYSPDTRPRAMATGELGKTHCAHIQREGHGRS